MTIKDFVKAVIIEIALFLSSSCLLGGALALAFEGHVVAAVPLAFFGAPLFAKFIITTKA